MQTIKDYPQVGIDGMHSRSILNLRVRKWCRLKREEKLGGATISGS